MRWFDVDGMRRYLANLPPDAPLDPKTKPTRKMVYGLVENGLKVARIGDSGRRLMFSAEWADEFLVARAARVGTEPIRS